MSKSRSLLSGVVFNFLNIATSLAIAFFLPRLMLKELGESQLGLWQTLMDLLGYFTLTDLGIGRATTRYLSHYFEKDEKKEFMQVLATSLKANRILAIVAFFIILGVTFGFPYFAKSLPNGMSNTAIHLLVFVTGFKVVVDLLGHAFTGTSLAIGRFREIHLSGLFTNVVTTSFIVYSIYRGWGLIAMAAVPIFASLLNRLFAYYIVKKYLKYSLSELPPVDGSESKKLFSFGMFSFFTQMAQRAGTYSGSLLIINALGSAAVAPFGTAQGLASRCRALSKAVSDVIMPTAAKLNTQNDPNVMQRIAILSSRSMGVICLVFAINIFVMGLPFFHFWLDNYIYALKVQPIACLLMIATTIKLISVGLTSTIEGIGDVKLLWKYSAAEAILTVGLQWLSLQFWGIDGVAWGVMAAQVLVNAVALPITAARVLKINPFVMLTRIVIPLVITGVPGLAVAVGLNSLAKPTGIFHVLAYFSLVGMTLGGTAFFLCIDKEGRKSIVNNILGLFDKDNKKKQRDPKKGFNTVLPTSGRGLETQNAAIPHSETAGELNSNVSTPTTHMQPATDSATIETTIGMSQPTQQHVPGSESG